MWGWRAMLLLFGKKIKNIFAFSGFEGFCTILIGFDPLHLGY